MHSCTDNLSTFVVDSILSFGFLNSKLQYLSSVFASHKHIAYICNLKGIVSGRILSLSVLRVLRKAIIEGWM